MDMHRKNTKYSRMQEPIANSPIQGVIRTETGSQSAGTNITIQRNNYIITAGNDVINISMDSLLYDDVSSGFGRP